jgi:hypothetical protein
VPMVAENLVERILSELASSIRHNACPVIGAASA